MSDAHHPSNLPWLDRLNMHVQGTPGYLSTSDRRKADEMFRLAIDRRLARSVESINKAIQECESRQAEREIGSLQQIREQINRLADRVRRSSANSAFLESDELGTAKADTLHALEHALVERADEILSVTQQQPEGHDWLSRIQDAIDGFHKKLDARALLFERLI
ncbi:MAG TPA: hypothetical protein VFT74_14705 [Isosphaeraceae bacterium]|nr:hypothetical protein [Isosphaeraceae bacterium]